MAAQRVVVVGAGIAGLVSALRLAHAGMEVHMVEAAPQAGGKIRQLSAAGAQIDSGPTVFTMRWIFDQIYQAVGTRLEAQLQIDPLPVIARHAWSDGSVLDLFADQERSVAAVREFAGPAEADRFVQFCATARRVYDELEGPFIRSPSPSAAQMMGRLGARGLGVLMGLGPTRSLWDSLGRHFRDPRMRQLFARYATYCGSSPWEAPATLMLIAQVEMDGVWAIRGGMYALVQNLQTLAQARGVQFHFNTPCQRIDVQGGAVRAVYCANDLRMEADAVVFNGDVAALRTGLLGSGVREAVAGPARTRSLSALTWSACIPTSGFALDRHNVFFQSDYRAEFDDIFRARTLPQRPTVYICAQDRGLGSVPEGPERLLCLVNAPAVGDTNLLQAEDLQLCQTRTQDLLQQCGLTLDLAQPPVVRTSPVEFNQLFPATGGALYGQATHGWSSAFQRSNSASRIAGLYLAGGSVHPGPGVPMAAMSGQLAAEALMAHRNSTKRFHPVATSGGMSMP